MLLNSKRILVTAVDSRHPETCTV